MKERQRLYWIWAAMMDRCRNARNRHYANYGGRGITVCPRWHSFENFAADMGERPAGKSLDRTDNDGPYAPDNCVWADRRAQNGNRRNCIFVEFEGERVNLKEASRRAGLRYRQVHKRITQYGWTPLDALTIPIGQGGRHVAR